MSSRQKAMEANKAKIAADSKIQQQKAALAAKKNITSTNDSVKNQISIVQSKLSMQGLGEKTIAAQKALAEKFGIVTFDTKGNISNVPITRAIDPTIDVGTGRFTSEAFRKSVEVLTEQATPTTSGGSILDDFIIKPISQFLDDIFDNMNIDDLTPELKKDVEGINLQIDELKKQLEDNKNMLSELSDRLNRGVVDGRYYNSESNRLQNIIKKIEYSIKLLNDKKTTIFKQFKVDTQVRDEVKRLTDEMKRVSTISPLTAELKATIDELIKNGSAIVQRVLSEGLKINQELITDLDRAMLVLSYRIQEPIQENKSILDNGLEFINEQLFGFGTALAEIFEKIFNPDIETLKEQYMKITLAQQAAVLELKNR